MESFCGGDHLLVKYGKQIISFVKKSSKEDLFFYFWKENFYWHTCIYWLKYWLNFFGNLWLNPGNVNVVECTL